MEQRETMQKVVGILTEALELRRQARENPNSQTALTGTISTLLAETLPHIRLPASADGRAAADIVAEELGPAIVGIANCFSFAFVQLAEAHDEGRTDTSAADILRSISLQFANKPGL
ncbi:hypothetical protein [Streptomyces resistomycificus]|uniref:Uncharacterized protein n=1 Tax=Streptomyces resistomycificus TaxID=67356 RepID=A0A0L8LG71_9ACTN|nr:hypothetical protein [Streptomyces resistomycificus]KOG37104.1 hypothetical protein ADK37_11815 [Streptomyces resistomycificus]KUN95052.1 hypothetical protein AQJ84_23535 [Streptomyces resistomycificus]